MHIRMLTFYDYSLEPYRFQPFLSGAYRKDSESKTVTIRLEHWHQQQQRRDSDSLHPSLQKVNTAENLMQYGPTAMSCVVQCIARDCRDVILIDLR